MNLLIFLGIPLEEGMSGVSMATSLIHSAKRPARKACQKFRDSIREIRINNKIVHIEELAEEMNPVIRGWANYFTRFGAREARKALDYVNLTLVRWCKKKYKSLKGSKGKAFRYLA